LLACDQPLVSSQGDREHALHCCSFNDHGRLGARAESTDRVRGYGADSIFKPFGLLAIQDNGRRKPIDTFAKQTLVRLTGRSTYADKAGRRWTANDLLLSALLEKHEWKNEPMILVSLVS